VCRWVQPWSSGFFSMGIRLIVYLLPGEMSQLRWRYVDEQRVCPSIIVVLDIVSEL
jgi:hypothetical protein